MKRWTFWLLHALEAAILLAAVYFEPSYAIRGRLHGEALYQGRPTSYWRMRIDRWIDQCGSAEEALFLLPVVQAEPLHGGAQEMWGEWRALLVVHNPTLWERFSRLFKSGQEDVVVTLDPEILHYPYDGEEVLRELAKEDRYREIAERALANARVLRTKEAKR